MRMTLASSLALAVGVRASLRMKFSEVVGFHSVVQVLWLCPECVNIMIPENWDNCALIMIVRMRKISRHRKKQNLALFLRGHRMQQTYPLQVRLHEGQIIPNNHWIVL